MNYVDVGTIAKYYLKRLENKKIFADYIILATENFPFRDEKIFDQMLEQIHKNNNDMVYAVKEERGSIFTKSDKKIEKINDGFIPNKVRGTRSLVSRVGLSFVAKANVIRSGNFSSKNIGIFKVNDQFNFIEIDSKNIKNKKIKLQLDQIF